MIRRLRRQLRETLLRMGLDLRRAGAWEVALPIVSNDLSMSKALTRAVRNGVKPDILVDVGVADGTPCLYDAFPDARLVLVEPLTEFHDRVSAVAAERPGSIVIMGAAGPDDGSVQIHVHPDLDGSSILLENEDASEVNGVPRTVPQYRLDTIFKESDLNGSVVLKVDVQGAELQVLQGASAVLGMCDYVILETSLFEFFEGGPLIGDVVAFMEERGFVPYDFFDAHFRLLDGAMSQIDIGFVRRCSSLRREHAYATAEQRAEQTARMRKARQELEGAAQ
jgi:FkbM family methyltransferase